jgi:photosynthetic reaction center cytochrome c subunit
MARELNTDYLLPLGKVLPPNRLGPMGDAPKVACATCHQGVNKPLYAAPMAKDFPGLYGPDPAASAAVVAMASAKPAKTAVKGK